MTELDQAIKTALTSVGQQDDVNKVYLIFLRSSLFIPVKKADLSAHIVNEEEPFSPLFAKIDENYFMLAFNSLERLTAWAGDHITQMDYVELTGRDIVAGMNDNVYLSLNLGTTFHKEFSPDEIKRLKVIVSKIDRLKS